MPPPAYGHTRRSFASGISWLVLAGGAAFLFRDRIIPPKLAFQGEAATSGWLPFASRSPMPVVAVGVGGRMVMALVDSGAQYSVVDRAFADELALPATWTPPMIAYGIGGGGQVGRGVALDLTLGALEINPFRAVALSLGPIAASEGLSVPLVLGQDLLNGVIADIDFPGRRLALHRPEAFSTPAGAVAAPARRNGRALEVTVSLEDKPLDVIVDTGATAALSLSRETAQIAGLLDDRGSRNVSTMVLGGMAQGQIFRASTLTLAGQAFNDVDIHVYDIAGPRYPAGLLGVGALDRSRAILDLAQGSLHLIDRP